MYEYWAYIGTLYLIILTYKDFKNNMMVDDRHNHFMLGLSVSLWSHKPHTILYTLLVIIITIALHYYMKKYKVLGDADIKTISWLFLGFAIINLGYLIWFFSIFFIMFIIYWGSKKYVFKLSKPTPFYYVLMFSFISVCAILGLY